MRKGFVALGIFLLFLGLILIASSRTVIEPDPILRWATVQDIDANPSAELLSVQGDLKSGDSFRVYFTLAPLSQQMLSQDAAVLINVTDPEGSVKEYDIPLALQGVQVVTKAQFPEGVTNRSGTYKIDAWAIWGPRLLYLTLEKKEFEESEPQYPYNNFFPVGAAVALGGIGTSVFGVKSSERKRVPLKRRSSKRRR